MRPRGISGGGIRENICMAAISNSTIKQHWESLNPNDKGLVPVITTDNFSNEVLMMAWMNQEAFFKTLETKSVTYFSRSRNSLWIKGEKSGNKQKLIEMRIDCDADTILLKVEQEGVACHTGDKSCFDGLLVWSAQ